MSWDSIVDFFHGIIGEFKDISMHVKMLRLLFLNEGVAH